MGLLLHFKKDTFPARSKLEAAGNFNKAKQVLVKKSDNNR